MIKKKIGLIAILASFAGSALWAGDFSSPNSYAIGDVLIGFRNGGANDLVVDAGPISTLTSASPNQRISITQYSVSQLNSAFGNANAVSWSAFTWFDDSVSPPSAQWTLFVTKPRTSLNKQTSPWVDANADSQQNPALRMQTIPVGANVNLAFNGLNSPTAVIDQNSSADNPNYPQGQSYNDALFGSAGGNFNNTFQGNPENTTPADFTTSGMVVCSDFYQMTPTSGFGTGILLGYFEFATDGTMTYVAYPSAVPVIKSINRASNTTTISYTTGLYGTYTLRGTNTLSSGMAATNWPAITTLTSGDTATHTYPDTDASPNKFYIITAQ
jgi:hypothetical protein